MDKKSSSIRRKTYSPLQRLSYDARRCCLQYVLAYHRTRIIGIDFAWIEEEKKWEFMGADTCEDQDFSIDPGIMFRELYGYFTEDRSRSIFFVFQNQFKISFIFDDSELNALPEHSRQSVKIDLAKFVPQGLRTIDIANDPSDCFTPIWDLSNLPRYIKIVHAPFIGNIAQFVTELCNSKLRNLECVEVGTRKFRPTLSMVQKLCRNTSNVTLCVDSIELCNTQEMAPFSLKCDNFTVRGFPMEHIQSGYREIRFPFHYTPIFSNCKRIFAMNLTFKSGSEITDLYKCIGENCMNLRSFSLFRSKICDEHLTEHNTVAHLFKCKFLKSLTFAISQYFEGDLQNYESESMLETIKISMDGKVNPNSPKIMDFIKKFLEHHKKLRVFHIGNLCNSDQILRLLEALTNGNIGNLANQDTPTLITSVIAELQRHQHITTVGLHFGTYTFSEDQIVALSKLTHIQSLYIQLRNFIKVSNILFSMSHLSELYVNFGDFEVFPPTTVTYEEIANFRKFHLDTFEARMKKLKRLVLHSFDPSILRFLRYAQLPSLQSAAVSPMVLHDNVIMDREWDVISRVFSALNKERSMRVFEIFRTLRFIEIGMDEHEVNMEEEKEYLKKCVDKWGLYPPYYSSKIEFQAKHFPTSFFSWKEYFDERKKVEDGELEVRPNSPVHEGVSGMIKGLDDQMQAIEDTAMDEDREMTEEEIMVRQAMLEMRNGLIHQQIQNMQDENSDQEENEENEEETQEEEVVFGTEEQLEMLKESKEQFKQGLEIALSKMSSFSEELKEMVRKSWYITSFRMESIGEGTVFAGYSVVFYSVFGDGMKYVFDIVYMTSRIQQDGQRPPAHSTRARIALCPNLSSEGLESAERSILNQWIGASEDMRSKAKLFGERSLHPEDSPLFNYTAMSRTNLEEFGYWMFNQYLVKQTHQKKIQENLVSVEDVFRLMFALFGGYCPKLKVVPEMLNAETKFLDLKWLMREHKLRNKFEFEELKDDKTKLSDTCFGDLNEL